MGTKTLVINIGSTSKRYSIFEDLDEIAHFHFDPRGSGQTLTVFANELFDKDEVSQEEYDGSLGYLLNYCEETMGFGADDIFVVAFRVAMPGEFFLVNREIDKQFISELRKAQKSDTRHTPPLLAEILKSQKLFKDLKHIAVSDSAFHGTNLRESDEMEHLFGCRHNAYGISVESIVEKIKSKENSVPVKTIVCHLGSKIGVTAVVNGKSLDTVLYHLPCEDGQVFDLQLLRRKAFEGDDEAKLVIRMYVYNCLKKITEMISVAKGIDCLVFSGEIGFRADYIRELILDDLRWLGLDYDLDKNSKGNMSSDYMNIEKPDSSVKVIVAKSEEMRQVARCALRMV